MTKAAGVDWFIDDAMDEFGLDFDDEVKQAMRLILLIGLEMGRREPDLARDVLAIYQREIADETGMPLEAVERDAAAGMRNMIIRLRLWLEKAA